MVPVRVYSEVDPLSMTRPDPGLVAAWRAVREAMDAMARRRAALVAACPHASVVLYDPERWMVERPRDVPLPRKVCLRCGYATRARFDEATSRFEWPDGALDNARIEGVVARLRDLDHFRMPEVLRGGALDAWAEAQPAWNTVWHDTSEGRNKEWDVVLQRWVPLGQATRVHAWGGPQRPKDSKD